MSFLKPIGHVFGGAMLITGVSIGVGMLAMPVVTATGGFLPVVAMYLICWLFMLCTGLLFLEVCIWMPKESNMITMAHKLLGKTGRTVAWIAYLALFLTVMVAHVAAGGDILREILGQELPLWGSKLLYVSLFSPIIFFGTRWVDRCNLLLVAGLSVSYLFFVFLATPHVNLSKLTSHDWSKAWFALPVLFTAFTYQVIIPTLMTYMERNAKRVRASIFIGTLIPLIVYLLWEFLILGTVPLEGQEGLLATQRIGGNAIAPLRAIINSPYLFSAGKSFAFFTLTASYLALALAYLDFLIDGLKLRKDSLHKLWLCLLIYVPPTIIALAYPHVFLTALSFAGGISCAILFGLFPPLMVWVGRHRDHYKDQTRQLFGGGYMLVVLILFVIFELAIEILQNLMPDF